MAFVFGDILKGKGVKSKMSASLAPFTKKIDLFKHSTV